MGDILTFLKEEGISSSLLEAISIFRSKYPFPKELNERKPNCLYYYYGKEVWEKALAALLAEENLLLSGPKATGKNVLAENLAMALGRPLWDVSFHVHSDASTLVGTDTYDGHSVIFREGPIYASSRNGGIAVLDEINMARNESLAVLHAALDYRRILDIPGYNRLPIHPASRFIGTMNYGYAGTRELNSALTSRFAILEMPLIAEADLQKLIQHSFPAIKSELRDQFIYLFYELQRKAEEGDISDRAVDLRGLLDALRLIQNGLKSQDALEMTIVNKSFDSYERKLVRDVIRARIASDLYAKHIFE